MCWFSWHDYPSVPGPLSPFMRPSFFRHRSAPAREKIAEPPRHSIGANVVAERLQQRALRQLKCGAWRACKRSDCRSKLRRVISARVVALSTHQTRIPLCRAESRERFPAVRSSCVCSHAQVIGALLKAVLQSAANERAYDTEVLATNASSSGPCAVGCRALPRGNCGIARATCCMCNSTPRACAAGFASRCPSAQQPGRCLFTCSRISKSRAPMTDERGANSRDQR